MSLDFNTSTDKPADERALIFKIDGVEYFASTKLRPNVALKFMHLMRTATEEDATDYMLTTMLGEEAYNALMDYDDLTTEQMEGVLNALQQILLGKTDENLSDTPEATS